MSHSREPSFAEQIREIRERFEGRYPQQSELQELLDRLQGLENGLPTRPVRPEFIPEPMPTNLPTKKKRRAQFERDWNLRQKRRLEEHERRLRSWRDMDEVWHATNATRVQIINSVRIDLRQAVNQGHQVQSLPWKFLPKAELTEHTIIQQLRDFQRRRPELKVDERRLREAFRLGPQAVYVGQDDFDGYFAFCFSAERAVLLDHPVVGNAAYVFGDDWRVLSRLTKSELLASRNGRFARVVHSSDWQSRIRAALLKRAHRSSLRTPPTV